MSDRDSIGLTFLFLLNNCRALFDVLLDIGVIDIWFLLYYEIPDRKFCSIFLSVKKNTGKDASHLHTAE